MIRIRVLAEAESDLTDALRFYEARSSGLGEAFLVEVERSFGLLIQSPEAGRLLESGQRRLLMRRFPYSILYRLEDEDVLVLALAHHRRRPGVAR